MVRGRKPKPTNFRLIEGNREHRTIHKETEPQPFDDAPPRPPVLTGKARQHWEYLISVLDGMKILGSSDQGTIMAAAIRFGEVYNLQVESDRLRRDIRALRKAQKDALPKTKKQNLNKIQALTQLLLAVSRTQSQAIRDMVAIENNLGLNPTARTRIKVDSPTKAKTRREKLLS